MNLEVRSTQEKGLGVFATKPFSKGDLIECCRVIVLPKNELMIVPSTSVLRHFIFEWEKKFAIPTGFGCFYNHSYEPNSIHAKQIDMNEIHYYALRDIAQDEEITINYGGFPTYSDPLWFEVK